MKINEIFYSIQGESTRAGLPCAFVRLTGCNLRCAYCDTSYAYEEGGEMSVDEVLREVGKFPIGLVEITGGEPLLQPGVNRLITALADGGRMVMLETNGSVSIADVDRRAVIIMDIKCPGSGVSGHMRWENIPLLKPADEVKFVLSDRRDFEWALDVLGEHRLAERHAVHFSPAFGILDPRELAGWMLDAARKKIVRGSRAQGPGQEVSLGNIRLQLQLHKYIWPHAERGV